MPMPGRPRVSFSPEPPDVFDDTYASKKNANVGNDDFIHSGTSVTYKRRIPGLHTDRHIQVQAHLVRRSLAEPLGFSLVTAAEEDKAAPQGIRVGKVIPGSPAAESGSIQPHDRIIELNGYGMNNRSHEEAVYLLKNSGSNVSLVLERPFTLLDKQAPTPPNGLVRRGIGKILSPVQPSPGGFSVTASKYLTVHRHPINKQWLFSIEGGLEQDSLPTLTVPKGPLSPFQPLVDGESTILQGDILLEIDGIPAAGLLRHQIVEMLNESGDEIKIRLISSKEARGVTRISQILSEKASDSLTAEFQEHLRHTIVRWALLVTSRPRKTTDGPDGHRYIFVSTEQFHAAAAAGEFLEWSQHKNQHFYGIPRKPIEAPAARAGERPGTPMEPRAPCSLTGPSPMRSNHCRTPSLEDILSPLSSIHESGPTQSVSHGCNVGLEDTDANIQISNGSPKNFVKHQPQHVSTAVLEV